MADDLSQEIEELQLLEQNIQSLLMQKQSSQIELNEIVNALEELSTSDDEVYKILSGIMVKTKKVTVQEDLNEKRKVLDIRIGSIDKQEAEISNRIESLREQISKGMNKTNK